MKNFIFFLYFHGWFIKQLRYYHSSFSVWVIGTFVSFWSLLLFAYIAIKSGIRTVFNYIFVISEWNLWAEIFLGESGWCKPKASPSKYLTLSWQYFGPFFYSKRQFHFKYIHSGGLNLLVVGLLLNIDWMINSKMYFLVKFGVNLTG